MSERTSTSILTERESLVLDEMREICQYSAAGIGGTYIRAYHVRHFRGERTHPELRELTLGQIQYSMRQLDRKGYLSRRGRHLEYKPKEANDGQ